MKTPWVDRLAVCSWSLQPATPNELLQKLREIGILRIQCAIDPLREHPSVWGKFAEECSQAGVQIASGMFGCVGEDYSTMDSIRRTGGIVPDSTWDQNWKNIQSTAEIAQRLNLKLVTFHAGFLPHEEKDPAYAKLLHRLRMVADLFAARGLDLALETGQETASTLNGFLMSLGRPNVGVNFDPANMILYDKGNPIEALRTLGSWLKQCHIKDANKTRTPGAWGDEVVVGTGQVNWREFFKALEERSFKGWLSIEREAGHQRVQDIQAAHKFIVSLA
ncbi:MAG: sugar phosphate isomerase/epimerase [Verrucomicrobia bacterium]|nr:sugar phosphate isomerase/epimerase [Verrucomicrobiota bacterium]